MQEGKKKVFVLKLQIKKTFVFNKSINQIGEGR